MKKEEQNLIPYLPYKLQITYRGDVTELTGIHTGEEGLIRGQSIIDIDDDDYPFNSDYWKPILRPLSDLTKEDAIYHDYQDEGHLERSLLSGHAPYSVWVKFVSEHFDVFGLIEKGLAIDINTINPQ